jgi:hypothetical protein
MTRDEITEYIGFLQTQAKEMLVKDGEHAPMVFLFPPHDLAGEPAIISLGALMGSGDDKELAAEAIRGTAQRVGASGVALIFEAWLSPAAVSQKWGLRPSQDPDRIEVLSLSWEFRVPGESEKITGVWYQHFHHEGDKIALDQEWEMDEPSTQGLFTNLLV